MASDPYQLIDTIVEVIDDTETAKDSQGMIKSGQLLNNDLKQAIATNVFEQTALHTNCFKNVAVGMNPKEN